MSALPALVNGNRARGWALWVLPAVALAALVGWETDWGRQIVRVPSAPPPVEPKPVTAAALPEYRIEGGLPAHAETVARTLFNATRRPAPALAGDGGPQTLRAGQFQLMGTTVTGERNIAFLKEVGGGKSRVVRQGDQINGMVVASVGPDRVKLTLGDESEELVLKVAPGPKTTIAPAPPVPGQAVAGAAAPAAPAVAAARGPAARVQPGVAGQTPQQDRQARRAARQAAAQGQGATDAGTGSTGDSSGQGSNQVGRRGRH
jgi:hypothetical protein